MRKLRSNKGESIAEALAALLVAVLGGLLVDGAVASATKSMDKTDAMMRAYYERVTALSDVSKTNSSNKTAVLKSSDGKWFTFSSKGTDGKGTIVTVYTEKDQDHSLSFYQAGITK